MSLETHSRFEQTIANTNTNTNTTASSSSSSSSIEHHENPSSIPDKEMTTTTTTTSSSVSQIKRITSIDGIWIIDKQEILDNLTNFISKPQNTSQDLKETKEIIFNSPRVAVDVEQVQQLANSEEKFQSCDVKLTETQDSVVKVQEMLQNDDNKRSGNVEEEEEKMVGNNKNGFERNVEGKVFSENGLKRRKYSRGEMESLRFLNLVEQKAMWDKVYLGMRSNVLREYDGLAADSKPQKQGHKNADPRQRSVKRRENAAPTLTKPKKKDNATVFGEVCNHYMEHNLQENVVGEDCSLKLNKFGVDNPLHSACAGCGDDEVTACKIVENECDKGIGSEGEDEFDSIQRPAFLVEGDPDFDTGPPEDGLEYLRRVRWEAAQIPKVKVAKLEKINLKSEQTVYMPMLPDIAKCPEHLLPSKLWEDAFLADFSELRLAFMQSERLFLENPKHLQKRLNENDPSCSGDPTLSTVLGMDAVSRAKMLRSRIRSLEDMNTLFRKECAWLYALCAVVDTPLDADTGASLRCLLRKCAKLRSEKSECDDEVAMLNILVTVSGRYFGQSEK